jgi:integrase/recombinase XerD
MLGINYKKHRQWLTQYLINCKGHNKSKKTLINYETDLRLFIAWYEVTYARTIDNANGETITKYLDYLQGANLEDKRAWYKRFLNDPRARQIPIKNLGVSSRRRHLSSLNNFFLFLQQTYEDKGRLFQKNPVKNKIHRVRVKQVDVNHTTLLTQADWDLLWASTFKVRDKLILSLMYYGGLRLEEVVNLNISDFNFQKKTLTFIRKGGYRHELELNGSALIFDLLSQWLRIRTIYGEILFPNKHGKRISVRGMYALIIAMIKRADCPTQNLSPHSFRKACATNLYMETKDLLLVRDYLNHKDAKVTQTYIQI